MFEGDSAFQYQPGVKDPTWRSGCYCGMGACVVGQTVIQMGYLITAQTTAADSFRTAALYLQ